jgi:hypothetical protein
MIRIALAALLFSTSALGQAPVTPSRVGTLAWMAGGWSQETPQGKVTENWLGPANGVMVAVNLSSFASGRTTFEFLRIAETPAGFSYFASPGGKPAVEFAMKELAEKRVVFENAGHDFPQRILYWRDGEALMARIEGTINGQPRSREWKFMKAAVN